jgi:hypothetical protein
MVHVAGHVGSGSGSSSSSSGSGSGSASACRVVDGLITSDVLIVGMMAGSAESVPNIKNMIGR